ncbi:MAG: hypothetical protein P8K68_01245 [Algibacter sp.]|uniref:hypothetical protein n=1 Tax=Algibacter sp. TaxID=1872428 RepID=UPI0026300934|nr:hypothetical protein [Algibacter sp.]MDG1730430.1 hypothetical protein [Algibacter sp.]MDG2177398.1 hypothetical protein [Algibacter sp.]
MKIFNTLILITISLCAGLCCPPEEEYDYQSIEIKNNNLVQIENDKTTFQLNDTIYVNTIIDNNQITVDNKNIILSDFLNLDTDPYLYFNLTLYKKTRFGTLSKIAVTNSNIVVLNGLAKNSYDEIIEVKNEYDSVNFTSKFGIKLLESGTYYLAPPNFDYSEYLYINGISRDYDQITIFSKIKKSEDTGAYKFFVE